jgi:ribosomal protein L1
MDAEAFNLSVRAFLKKVGVNSQREIERYVEEAVREGHLRGDETLAVRMQLDVEGKAEPLVIESEVRLR